MWNGDDQMIYFLVKGELKYFESHSNNIYLRPRKYTLTTFATNKLYYLYRFCVMIEMYDIHMLPKQYMIALTNNMFKRFILNTWFISTHMYI